MKRLLLSTLFTLFAVAAFAQKGTVTGTVVDAETGETVAGAVLEFAPAAAPDKKQYSTSGFKGAVSIPSLAYGEYKLVVSFLGYNNAETIFKVSAAKQDIGKIELRPGVQIETVVKEAKALRTSQKGDTVSYNAGAFKVTDDADVEGLLKKMPGITVSDGTVEAQGESVKKIFVDGKEFFGEDVTTAIKSLPAQAVDRIEVYNKLSDAAEFSGMDDGEGYKALNIVTHANMRQGQFGKLYAGYGYDADTKTEAKNKYVIGGNANIFSGDSRVSVIGLFNNINQQNFSFEDILGVSGGGGGRRGGMGNYMVRPQSGVASVNAIGVNYSDTWGKRDQVSFQGSYFFNNTDTKNQSTVDKWYESPMPVDTLATRGYSNTEAYNHRFNARLEWKISDNQNLMVRPSFSYQSNDPLSTTQGWQFGQSGYSRTENFNDGLRHGYNLRTSAVYRAKLGKDGRTITVDGDVNYSDNTNNSNSYSNVLPISSVRPDGADGPWGWDTTGYTRLRYLRNLAPSNSYGLRGQFTYTEPVAKYAQVSVQYRIRYDYQERDKRSFITGPDYSVAGLLPDGALSNSYKSGYLTQSAGPGFRYSKERNTFVANVYYQHATLDGQIVRDAADKIKHSYNDVTYFMMGQLNINRENSLRLFVSSYTDHLQLISFFGRVNYTYKDTYLFTVTLRGDATSRFSKDNRWGAFPAVALGWKIINEPFMERATSFMSELKLRLGYGITGQQDISDSYFPYMPLFTIGYPTASYPFGDQYYYTIRPNGYDPNIKWEETTTWNAGIDFGFLNNRITGSLDYYYRETNDLISRIPVPAGSNLTNEIYTNVGRLRNEGIEFNIQAKVIDNKDFTWDLGMNVAWNSNKITKLNKSESADYYIPVGGIGGGTGNTVQAHKVGYPAYSYLLYEQVYDADGNPIEGLYADRNGDGVIDESDKYIHHSRDPKVVIGINSTMNWKNFDFGISLRANLGNYVYDNVLSQNSIYSAMYNSAGFLSNIMRRGAKFETQQYMSDYYLKNAGFLRCDNISLGYTWKHLLDDALRLRVYGAVQNPFVITKYKGLDPEVFSGIDNNVYPRPTTYTLGVVLTY